MQGLNNRWRSMMVAATGPFIRIFPPWWKVRLYGRLVGRSMADIGRSGAVRRKAITPHGYEMELEIDDPMERFAYDVGCYWGLDVIGTVWRLLRSGDIFIDVGANLGFITLTAAKRVGPEGKVFSFEPSPVMADRLKQALLHNAINNVTVYTTALGDVEGEGNLDPDDHSSKANLRNASKDGIRISVLRADDIFKDLPKEGWVFVKVDVEGYELRVLKGAQSLINRPKTGFLVEITDSWLKDLGGSAEELFNLMQASAYRAYLPKLNCLSRFELGPIDRPLAGEHHYDIVFLRPENGWDRR